MNQRTPLATSLQPFKWQLVLLPFFVASIWLALSLHVTAHRTEFVAISILYAASDVLMVTAFVGDTSRMRALSQACAMSIFTGIFFYTFIAYHEVQYILVQPLFWTSGWKKVTQELKPSWYPHALGEKALGVMAVVILVAAVGMFLCTKAIPTVMNLLQLVGLCGFGTMLAIADDARTDRLRFWKGVGAVGLWIFTLSCLGDVAYKYFVVGNVIATPLVAFLASLPVAIVSVYDLLAPRR